MKKKSYLRLFPKEREKKTKTILIMRMFLLFILAFNFAVSAGVYSQNSRFNLNMKNASMKEIIQEIQKQSDLGFLYNIEEIKTIPSRDISIKEATVDQVLKLALNGTPYMYTIQKNVILIKKTSKENSSQQEKERTITGIVTDNSGAVLPGVTVIVKGTNTGVSTDIDGKFTIKVPADKDLLIFSFVGMETKEVKITDKKKITVKLQNKAEQMDEVVVTGYQHIEKRKLSSSVITVKGDAIREGGAISVDNMLQGKIAGLSVLNPTSTVGAAPKIRIRGTSSISGNREPVWVVDGVILEDPVPISATELNSLDNVNLIGNAISSLNPEDIDRIDILKDASATAIYGVKAANGVIVITTKKGEKGSTKIRYSTSFNITERPQYSDLQRMNSKERIEVSKEIEERGLSYNFEPAKVAYEGALYDLYSRNISYTEFLQKVKTLEEQNTDWFDILYRTAISQKHSLTFSGGTDKINYYFSGGFNDNKGNFRQNNNKQYSSLMKLGMQLTRKLKVNLNLRASLNNTEYQHSNVDPYQYAYNTSRAIPCYNEDGSLSFYNEELGYKEALKYNIINELTNSERTIENQSISLNTNVHYSINSDLNFDGLVSVLRNNTYEKEWYNDKTFIAAKKRNLNYGTPFPSEEETAFYDDKCQVPYGGMLKNSDTKHTSYTLRASLSYKKRISNVHELSSSIGTEARSSKYEGISTREYGYLPERGDKFVYINPEKFPKYRTLMEMYPNIVTDRLTNVLSFYGTFTYAFDNRFITNFNIRADGSNKFGQDKNNRFLPVWSVSTRWNIHNESIFKNSLWLNQLALRASYGIQGNVSNDQNPNLIVQLGSTDPTSNHFISTLSKLPNPFLRWEKTTAYNLALDFSFLDGRIRGNADFYKKIGKDMIISKKVSITTGSNTMQLNAGNIENKGIDANISFTPIRTKNVTWDISINGGKNINKVTKSGLTTDFDYIDYLQGTAVIPGHAINTFYSYKFDGLDENGYPKFKDIEEEEGISKEEMYAKVFKASGQRVPDITGGFSSSLRYKKWSLNCLFSYSLGNNIRLNDLYKSTGQKLPQPQQNMDDIFVNRWRKPNDEKTTNIPVLSNSSLNFSQGLSSSRKIKIANNIWDMYNKSDLRVASGDFLRLRNVSLRYSLSKNICNQLHIASANLRLEASNLLTIKDKKLRGQDPEQVSFTFSTGTTPVTSTFTLGFDVTF